MAKGASTVLVNVRAQVAQKARWESAAKAAGLSLSAWMRRMLNLAAPASAGFQHAAVVECGACGYNVQIALGTFRSITCPGCRVQIALGGPEGSE